MDSFDTRRGAPGRMPPSPFGMGFGFPGNVMESFFGRSGGRDPFSDMFSMFDNDPFFQDPFFRDPFGRGHGLGPGPLFEQPPFARRLQQQPGHPAAPLPGVQIRELEPGEEHQPGYSGSGNLFPSVQHPDDSEDEDEVARRSSVNGRQSTGPSSQLQRGPDAHSGARQRQAQQEEPQVWSYSSSSVSHFGYGGRPIYSASTTHRSAPGGVMEAQHAESDSQTGEETFKYARGLAGQGFAVSRARNAAGEESGNTLLHNIEQEEVPEFDSRWQEQAQSSGLHRLGGSSSGPWQPALEGQEGGGRSHGSGRHSGRRRFSQARLGPAGHA